MKHHPHIMRLFGRIRGRIERGMVALKPKVLDLTKTEWPEKCRAAVTLSYDDALTSHREVIAPLLERHGLRATFYVHITAQDFMQNTVAWADLAQRGHELGNHTIFHPGRNNDNINPAWDLTNYSAARWREEVRVANWILSQVDGQTTRTFGNTCFDNLIGQDGFLRQIEDLAPELFVAARGELVDTIPSPRNCKLFNIGTICGDGHSFGSLRDLISEAIREHAWLILTFHGVTKAEHIMHLPESDHALLIEWLARNRGVVFSAPLRDVALHALNC